MTPHSDKLSYKGKGRIAIGALIFLGIVVLFFFMSQSLLVMSFATVKAPEDAERVDFSSDEIALLHNDAYGWYPGALYTPEDFADGAAPAADPDAPQHPADMRYGTNRLVLKLPEGKIYGISGSSASYAQKVWVNGVLLSEIGQVSDTPEGFYPHTTLYSVYFTADKPETEIVIQRANHNHVRGYYCKLYIGNAAAIAQMDKDFFMREGLITGSLLAIAIFFFGMFLFYSNRHSFLWFALACFFTALQNLIYNRSIMTIFPDLNWYLGHKIEYISLIAYFFFMFLYAFSMLEWKTSGGKAGKWFKWAGYVFFLGSIAVYAIFPSTMYTEYTKTMRELLTVYVVAGAVFLIVTVIRRKELRRPEHLLATASMVIMAVAWWIEQQGYMGDMTIAVPLATLLFAFIGAISLTISFSRTEQRLDLAERREQELAEQNKLLDSLNRMKSYFLANISHEFRAPLTIISGHAQLAKMQLDSGTVDDETGTNLNTVSLEAQRLSDLAARLLEATMERETGAELVEASFEEITSWVQNLFAPILLKNGNQLKISIESGCPNVRTNRDMTIQTLMNLVTNANRHTKNDAITLTIRREGDMAAFTVKDDGDGIALALLPHVFERERSGDGGPGLGLPICKEIVRALGGEIDIESERGKGTAVTFTLPLVASEEDQP